MKISELVQDIAELKMTDDIEILSVTSDTREVTSGSLFVAIRGQHQDGHDWIEQAFQRGAHYVIGDDRFKLDAIDAKLGILSGRCLWVPSSRVALDKMAQRFYGDPSLQMTCLGVTGTNGKTSITYMLEHVLSDSAVLTGVLGTIDHHLGQQVWPSQMTTPPPVALQARLQEMKNRGAQAIAMEVSSHAIDQHRVDGIHFDAVIFTNLTRDHLDYHKDMEQYFQAKQNLFTEILRKSKKSKHFAVVNVDDSWGRKLKVESNADILSYGKGQADFQFEMIQQNFNETKFCLRDQRQEKSWMVTLPMVGEHNVYNAVAVMVTGFALGIDFSQSTKSLQSFSGVPGRMQRVFNSKNLNVFIDYAHSPDALENVLNSLQRVRGESGGSSSESPKIWTLFGCGGDRDQGKRPLMATIAERLSDFVMVTSDNPRTEDPHLIIDQIKTGFLNSSSQGQWQIEVDRRRAIEKVLNQAQPHDVILIAGKGHEAYQIIGTVQQPFSDVEVVKELLR